MTTTTSANVQQATGQQQRQQSKKNPFDPSTEQVKELIAATAGDFNVPVALAMAIVKKESFEFDIHAYNPAGDYGVMQINQGRFGKNARDENGFAFKIDGARVQTDWQYNVRVGMSMIRDAYQKAMLTRPTDWVRATYAHYHLSPKHWHHYMIPGSQARAKTELVLKYYNEYLH